MNTWSGLCIVEHVWEFQKNEGQEGLTGDQDGLILLSNLKSLLEELGQVSQKSGDQQ